MNRYLLNDIDITNGQFTTPDGMKRRSVLLLSPEQMDAIGIVTLEEIHPTLSANQYENGTYEIDLVAKTATFNVMTIAPDPVTEVPLWKLRCILTTRGMIDDINTTISSLTEPYKTYATIAWSCANTVVRTSSILLLIQASMSLTDADVDDIFNEANTIDL